MPESSPMIIPQNLPKTLSLRHHRPFVWFWFARVFSALAFQISAVAVGWQIYALTGSAFSLGMVGLVQFLPMVVLTFLVGHIAGEKATRRMILSPTWWKASYAPFRSCKPLSWKQRRESFHQIYMSSRASRISGCWISTATRKSFPELTMRWRVFESPSKNFCEEHK